MKILKAGDNMSGVWAGKILCTGHGNGNTGCGALLEVSEEDLYGTHSSFMGRAETYYITILCPCCGAETDLANSDGNRHKELPRISRFRAQGFPMATTQQREHAQELLRQGRGYVSPRSVGNPGSNMSAYVP